MIARLFFAFVVIVMAPAGAKTNGALGCFARVYERAHLARHPDQIVTAVKLKIKRPPASESSYAYDFWLEVKMRGKDDALSTAGYCVAESGRVKCSVLCEGGGVDIVPHV